jgi:DNA-binding MarR family transcriptional regulator
MNKKEFILDSLIDDDEAFTQIVEYFELVNEIEISPEEIKNLINEMIEEGYITINYSWKNEYDEYPYSLTEKGRKAWENIQE